MSMTYFSPFPSQTLPRSTRTMTDSGQLRSSISLPGYHVDFFTFVEHVSFEHSTGSPWPVIYSGREGNINKQTYKTQNFFKLDRRSGSHACVFGRSPASARSGAGAATFLAAESTGTVLTPSQMSEIAGHEMVRTRKHIMRHKHLRAKYLYVAFFFRTPFSTTFR